MALCLLAMMAGLMVAPAQAATFPCSVGPADIPSLHFTNSGDGTTFQAIGLTSQAITATSGGCGGLVTTTAIRPLVNGAATATPGVPVPNATSQGGSLIRSTPNEVRYLPPSPGFSGTDTFTVDNNNTSRVITVTVIVDPAAASSPTVSSISPTSGPTAGGTTVSIAGANFTNAIAVRFGATAASGFTVNSATAITATAPAGTGTVDISVTTAAGTSATSAADQFTFVAAPVAQPASASVAYQTATPIDLSGAISGSHNSIAISSAPTHGTTAIAGDVITYTPAAGYSGSDSLAYTATGAGGTSAPATVSITVSAPTITLTPAAGTLPGATQDSAYSQGFSASGGASPYRFAVTAGALPAGLSLSTAGALTGIPTASGSFSFSVTATDANSATGTTAYSLTVTGAAPVAGGVSATVAANSSANPISLSLSGGAATSVAVAGAASHGTATASGTTISYTPTPGYSGSDSFTYTATNASGTSAPATVSITVSAPTLTFTPAAGALPAASRGSAYSQTVAASGGASPYSYAVSAGALPTGIALNAGSGALSGTPTVSGSFAFTVTATDAGGVTGSVAYTLEVGVAAPVAGNTSATVAANSTSNPITLTLSGGAATSIAVASAATHGTATASGTSIVYTPVAGYSGPDSFTYTASNASGTSAPATATITVSPPTLAFTPAAGALPAATQNTAYTNALGVTGGTAPYSFVVSAGSLAPGLTLDTATGALSGTPTAPGTFSFTITATDAHGATGAAAYSLAVSVQAPVAGPVSASIAANSSGNPITLNLSGGAAASVAVASAASHGTATPSGTSIRYTPTPGYSGSDSFTYTATNASGTSAPATVTLTIATPALTFTPSPGALPAGAQNSPYSTAVGASGGTAPYGFAITAGALPAGLALDATAGTVSGTPTASGSFSFTLGATDSHGATGTAGYTLSIAVAAPAAANAAATVAANSSNNPITLTLSGGTATSVAVASAAAHGTATASGTTIHYTPTPGYSGSDSFTYTATNASGSSAPATVTVTVSPPAFVFTPAGGALPAATQNAAYARSLAVAGGTAPYGFTVSAGSLPAGLVLDPVTGALSGTPTASGTFAFTITATDANGASGAAAYSLAVAVPAPIAGPASATVAANSSNNPITLTLSGGAATSVAVATAATHGTATASGTSISYTPTPGYSGSDSFTYVATNASGTSAPATATITVTAPALSFTPTVGALPTATQSAAYRRSIAVTGGAAPYAFAIGAGALPPGLSLDAGSGLLSGTPTVAGAFTFTVTVTDSQSATGSASYSLTIAAAEPIAANVSASVAADSMNNPITPVLSGGAATSVALASQPGHGSATVVGGAFQYSPAAGFSGTDSFTYTASNASGTSAPATATITVVPTAPVSHEPPTATVTSSATAASSSGIALSPLVTGLFDTIRISAAPSHGTVTLSHDGTARAGGSPVLTLAAAGGTIFAIYTPTLGYYGSDSFQFVAAGPGGQSAPATVSVNVVGVAPTAPSLTGSTTDNRTVSFDITSTATEGPFTDADILAVMPAGDATATIVAGGTGTARSFRLDVTPRAHFGGAVLVTYRIANRFGFSAPARITINVTARPDPSADPTIRAISDAQAEAARRFSRSQIDNFMRRTEALHDQGGKRFDMGVRMASNDGISTMRDPSRPEQEPVALDRVDPIESPQRSRSNGAQREPGQVAFWTGGAIDIGTRDQTSRRSKFTATTSGLSAGADLAIAQNLTVGLGGGYGRDETRIAAVDGNGSRTGSEAGHVSASTKLVAAYASAAPLPGLFVDAMAGHGWLDFSMRRDVTGTDLLARAARHGDYSIGSIAFGIDRIRGPFRWSAYGRGDYVNATLDAYRERGADIYDLRFDRRTVRSLTGVLGVRLGIVQPLRIGRISAQLRGEWQHEFQGSSVQGLDYADVVGTSFYAIRTDGWGREQFLIAAALSLELPVDWTINAEFGFRAAAGQRDAASRLGVSKKF